MISNSTTQARDKIGAWLPLDKCVLCGSPHLKNHFTGSKFEIPMSYSRCEACTAIFQNPRPTPEMMAGLFTDYQLFGGVNDNQKLEECVAYYDYSAYENALKHNGRPLLKKIAKYIPAPARLLEIGGATGWFMKAAQDAGYNTRGLDISPTLAGLVKERYGIEVTVSPIEEAPLSSESFDVICNYGGIECWMDIHKGLSQVNRMLRSNGIFFFQYVDTTTLFAKLTGKKYYQYNPVVNYFFSKQSMQSLLETNGFEVLSEKTTITYTSLGPIFHYFGLKKLFALARRLKIDRFVFLCPNLQSKTVVARKKGAGHG